MAQAPSREACRVEDRPSIVTRWLAGAGSRWLNAYTLSMAFGVYFCMYAFRKPFAAATFDGPTATLAGQAITLKTLFVVSQLIGYACSKYLGVRVNSEITRRRRRLTLVGLILAAEVALVVFGLIPIDQPLLKAVALFANGLPLGMVWGLVVQYLEGRRMSEVLLTGLACSYIVASGFVKDVGRALLAGASFALPGGEALGLIAPNPLPPISDYWMPAVTGALFLPAFLVFSWLLDQSPPPSAEDRAARVERLPMNAADRVAFLRRYGLAIGVALLAYFVLTAFRDYRDTFLVETFGQLGYDYDTNKTVVSRAEFLVAVGALAVLSQLYRFRSNRSGLIATLATMAGGMGLMGLATLLLDSGAIDGFWWVTLIGLGAYVAYVPFSGVLFDRVIAFSGFAGTAVFGIYIADAAGYTGSVALYLAKDTLLGDAPHLEVLRRLAYAISIGGVALLALSGTLFLSTGPCPTRKAADRESADDFQ